MLERAGMTAIVEPIDALVTRPGWLLPGAKESLQVLRQVDPRMSSCCSTSITCKLRTAT